MSRDFSESILVVEAVVGRLVVAAALAGGVYLVGLCLSRLPGVWRGDALASLPIETLRGPRVDPRSYPVFTIWLTTFVAGLVVAFVGALVRLGAVAAVGVLLVLAAMFVLFPLWLLVNAINRPRFIVPPAWRTKRAGWVVRRSRRRQGSANGVSTAHLVEILDVRPLPEDERNQFEPYLVARCATDGCGWMSDVVDSSERDCEETVRRQAVGHSPIVTGPIRPVG